MASFPPDGPAASLERCYMEAQAAELVRPHSPLNTCALGSSQPAGHSPAQEDTLQVDENNCTRHLTTRASGHPAVHWLDIQRVTSTGFLPTGPTPTASPPGYGDPAVSACHGALHRQTTKTTIACP